MCMKIKIIATLLLFGLYAAFLKQIVSYYIKLSIHNDDQNRPNVNTDDDFIPRIIHQLWNDQFVPRPVVPYMKRWMDQHPDWQYWFWTKESQEKLIRKKYPTYLSLYQGYELEIQRSDMIRFLILYEFGGIYADLDMEVLKPLDDIIQGKPCLLAAATEEVATVFLETNETFITNNALIACKPRHRLLKLILEGFFKGRRNKDVMSSTGPLLLDSVVKRYIQSMSKYSNVVQHMRNQFDVLYVVAGNPGDDFYIAHSEYFLTNFAPIHTRIMRLKCGKLLQKSGLESGNLLSVTYQRKLEMCTALEKSNYSKTATAKSYTVHHWMGSWVPKTGWVDTHKGKNQHIPSDRVNVQRYFKGLRNVSGVLKCIS